MDSHFHGNDIKESGNDPSDRIDSMLIILRFFCIFATLKAPAPLSKFLPEVVSERVMENLMKAKGKMN